MLKYLLPRFRKTKICPTYTLKLRWFLSIFIWAKFKGFGKNIVLREIIQDNLVFSGRNGFLWSPSRLGLAEHFTILMQNTFFCLVLEFIKKSLVDIVLEQPLPPTQSRLIRKVPNLFVITGYIIWKRKIRYGQIVIYMGVRRLFSRGGQNFPGGGKNMQTCYLP